MIKNLQEEESYKYLGVQEFDDIKTSEMKERVRKDNKRRVRKVLETKLNGNNIIKAINTWAFFGGKIPSSLSRLEETRDSRIR